PSESAFVSKEIGNHEANVVASMRVFGAGVAQACDQANRFLFHCRAIEIRNHCQSGSDKSILLLWLFFFWGRNATLARWAGRALPRRCSLRASSRCRRFAVLLPRRHPFRPR